MMPSKNKKQIPSNHETTKEGEFVVILNGTIRCMSPYLYRRSKAVGKTVFLTVFFVNANPAELLSTPH